MTLGHRPVRAAVSAAVRRPSIALAALSTVAVAICLGGGLGGEVLSRDLSNVSTVVIAGAAGVACLVRAARETGRMGLAWVGIGLGSLSYGFGEGVWTWTETVREQVVPSPGLSDVGYLGMVPFMAAGFLVVPVARQSIANRVRSVVDGLMIAASLLLVSWIFVIGPLFAAGSDSALGLVVVLAYPISDVILATVVLHALVLMRRGGQHIAPLVLIGGAMLVMGLSDTVYAYLALDDAYQSGGLVDAGWYAGFALVLIAARLPGDGVPAAGADPVDTIGEERPFAIAVPYAVVVLALVVSVFWYAYTGSISAFAVWCRSGLIVLIVGRQLLTVLENRELTATLESRVARRTAELLAREQRYRALVQQSSESVAVVGPDSTIRYQSESIERIFGYPPAMLIGRRLVDVLGHGAGIRIAAGIECVLGSPYASTTIETAFRHHVDGTLRHAEMTITNLLDDPSVGGIVLNTRDVSEAKALENQLAHEAYHDSLTGLASRVRFQERLTQALRDCRSGDDLAVLLLDLDAFKEINDSLGHAAGDQLLQRVAQRLRSSVRDTDTVARFGGDEFAVLVESIIARADAETAARRIVAAMAEPFVLDDRELRAGVSVGIASAADAHDADQLLRNADLAMYQAKEAGGDGFVVYHPRMHDALIERLQLEADLRLALDRDELVLHYQPTVDLATGEITGFEALVRWDHPLRGLVPPLDFIGVAESTGLIVPLGRWVLAEACRQAVAWGAGSGRRLRMSVNVSVRQFERSDLVEMVSEVLASTGMPPDRLCLEMTESVLLTDTEENLAQLLRLKELGVTLAMDDFGTGYSSLAYLRRLPMDILKIDRSFVGRLAGDRQDVALVRMIVRLGQSLGVATVAEGIEDAAQLAALREMGCDCGQGYYLSRPLPPAEAAHLLAATIPVAA